MSRDALLLVLVFGPFLAALAVPWLGRRSERWRDGWVMLVTTASVAGAARLAALVAAGARLEAGLPLLVGRLEFAADHFSALFALFCSFLWCCATLYSLAYMKTQRARDRYHAASLVVLGAMLGVVLAADLVTLFLFFETLGLVAFLLVVHTGTPEARQAAIQYFWMTILGGIALLAGIMLVYDLGGGSLSAPLAGDVSPVHRAAAAALMVLGFGVKAGMVPVHFWLPNAHPVAPSPASALLSGAMIKAGAYGIFRCVSAVFQPSGVADPGDSAWAFAVELGLIVTWLGIITMALGVLFALGQSNAKRMLAYHSISQMGFILAGLGAGGYLLGEGALGTAGGLLHAVNHALFKACLFLGAGAVALRAGSLDMYALGGLWRRMPVTFALMLVAAAGITGLPWFNGFVSKSMIHHALEAAHAASGTGSLKLAERIFVLTAVGTSASFIKLIGLIFLRRSRLETPESVREAPAAMLVAMGLLCVPVIVLGWRPELLLGTLLAPGLAATGVPVDGIGYYLGHYFLSAGDIGMSLVIFALGGVVFAVGMRYGLFHLHLPAWLGIDYWLRRAGRATAAAFEQGATGMRGARGEHGAQFLGALRGVSRGYHRAGQQGGGALGELLLLVFQGITFLYGQVQQRVAWLLRAVRRRFLLGMGEAGLARRQLVESVLVGQPGSPAQSFLEAAWGALEQDRHATVRAVLAKAAETPAPAGTGAAAPAEGRIEAARALAGLMSGTVFEARLEGLSELARSGGATAAREGFAALHRELQATRAAIGAAALQLAEARASGEDIVREVAAVLQPVLAREAGVLAATATAKPTVPTTPEREVPLPPLAPPRQARRWRNAFGAWLRDMARLAIAELRQNPSSWPRSEALDTEPGMVAARRGIQRYARDVALNVVAIFLVLSLLMAALWLGG